MKTIDLDKLKFNIRKSSPDYNRLKIENLGKGHAKITFTDDDYDLVARLGITGFASVINHEFIHWILFVFVGEHTGDHKYDNYLDSLGLYTEKKIQEIWL